MSWGTADHTHDYTAVGHSHSRYDVTDVAEKYHYHVDLEDRISVASSDCREGRMELWEDLRDLRQIVAELTTQVQALIKDEVTAFEEATPHGLAAAVLANEAAREQAGPRRVVATFTRFFGDPDPITVDAWIRTSPIAGTDDRCIYWYPDGPHGDRIQGVGVAVRVGNGDTWDAWETDQWDAPDDDPDAAPYDQFESVDEAAACLVALAQRADTAKQEQAGEAAGAPALPVVTDVLPEDDLAYHLLAPADRLGHGTTEVPDGANVVHFDDHDQHAAAEVGHVHGPHGRPVR